MTKPPLASMSISPEVTENPQDLCVEPHHRHSDAEGRTPRLRCWGLVAHTPVSYTHLTLPTIYSV